MGMFPLTVVGVAWHLISRLWQLDMFDGDRVFGMQIPSLAQASPPLMYAILALSARQIECKEKRKNSFDSLELYQEAIRLLAPLLGDRDVKIIPICVVLCCLEMMSASAQDWRRHLEGCAALFSAFGVHGFSGGMLQAVFWCYARMGTCRYLILPDMCVCATDCRRYCLLRVELI
jgi:hypothetical protein